MKPLVVEYELTREEYVAGLFALLSALAADDPNRSKMAAAYLFGILILLLIWAIAGWDAWSLLFAALFIPIGMATIERVFSRRGVGSTFDPREAATRVEFSDDGIYERTANRERRYAWTGVRHVFDTPDAIAFRLAGADLLVVPHRALSDEQRQSLEAGLAEFGHAMVVRGKADAKAGIQLPETAFVGKMSVAVTIMAVAQSIALSPKLLDAAGEEKSATLALAGIAIGLLAAVAGFFLAGALIRAVARRSAARAVALAWSFFFGGAIIFYFVFLRP